jgi:hypothetical protein
MAQEIVITSVRRGLDGGSGYQPVLRTQGMKPAIAERLQIRSGYSHPYPFGDPRNPVIFIHRIERVAGQTLNVLGRICDAGSDHTGRSNFLAHLAALDDTEARRKTAGPADVARRFAFKTTWNEQPREADPPPVIGADRSPAPCAAWRAAGLDPGLAGDLAEAAANGKETRLVVRQGDDVLALFADAIALLPPAKRWQVTFNTCEIEPFDATWRAVREDLPQARSWRGSPGVVDLTSSATKGSDSIYARFARGEASALPWQTPASDSAKPSTAVATSSPQVPPAEESSQQEQGPVAHHAPGTQVPPVAPSSPGDTAPPPPDLASPPAGPKKRNYLEHVERATSDRDQREYATPTQSKALRFAGIAAVVTLLLTLIGVLAAIFFNPELATQVPRFWRGTEDSGDKQVALAEPDRTGEGSTSLGEAEQAERKRRDDETARNKKLAEEADRVAREAEQKLKTADDERMALERKQKEAAARAAEQQAGADKLKKQKTAYDAIAKHEPITLEDLPVAGGIGGGPQKQAVICKLDPPNLLDLSFDLAVPRDNPLSEGQPFEAAVQPSAEQRLTWQISATPTRTIDKDSNAKPIPLATISVTDGQLVLKPARNELLGNQLFSHLRQSVLLVKARNPEQPDTAAGVVKAIQLVRPVAKGPFKVDLLSSSTKIDLNPPRGIFADTKAGKQEGFPRSAVVEYEIAYGFTFHGTQKEEVYSRKWTSAEPMPFVPILQCPQSPNVQPNSPPSVGLQIAFGAGLSPLIISPEIQGLGKDAFDLHAIARTIRESDDEFQRQLHILERQLANKIRPFCGPVDGVNVNNLNAFIKQNERDLAPHFQADAYAAWIKECQQIIVQAAQVPRPAKNLQVPGRGLVEITPAEFERNIAPSRTQWQHVFVERIQAWAADHAKRQQEQLTQARKYFTPLKTAVLVTVRTITTTAKKDEIPYTVTLLKGDPDGELQSNSGATSPASDRPQL